jgi:hypothetical protein
MVDTLSSYPLILGFGRDFVLDMFSIDYVISLMFLFLVVHLLVLPFVLAVTTTTTTTVLHRIYHPLLPPVQFSIRGSLLLSDGSVTFSSAETVAHDLRYFAESLQSLDGALYQIALERKGDPTQGHWSFSSVNAVRPSFSFPIRPALILYPLVSSSHPHGRSFSSSSDKPGRSFCRRLSRVTSPPQWRLS